MTDCLLDQNIVPGIKVDKVLNPSCLSKILFLLFSLKYLRLSLWLFYFSGFSTLVPLPGQIMTRGAQGLDVLALSSLTSYKQGAHFA